MVRMGTTGIMAPDDRATQTSETSCFVGPLSVGTFVLLVGVNIDDPFATELEPF